MEKQIVVNFFGGWKETAQAMDLTYNACQAWSDPLPVRVAQRVIAVGIQVKGVEATKRTFPLMFKRRAS